MERKKGKKRSSTTRCATIKLVRGGFVMTIVACGVERTREREREMIIKKTVETKLNCPEISVSGIHRCHTVHSK